MDAWQVPIITAALEFLYDVGRRLVDEIATRKNQDNVSHEKTPDPISSELERYNKAELMATKVNVEELEEHKEKLDHLLRLRDIYTKNYYNAKEKTAMWGPGLVPPIVLHELDDAESNLLKLVGDINGSVKAILKLDQ
jgi:hypothetical protein